MKSIEILGPWLKNKGDELMLRSVINEFESRYELGVTKDLKIDGQKGLPKMYRLSFPSSKADMENTLNQQSVNQFLKLTARNFALKYAPQGILKKTGRLSARSLVVLFDCSGFAYGDYWPATRLITRAHYYKKLRDQGVKLIMLPQALGPFEEPELRLHARHLLNQFDYIFPRESISERHIIDLGLDSKKVESVPDVSHLLKGIPPSNPEVWTERVAIVPNARMLDKVDAAIAERYLDFLIICIKRVLANRLEPVILLHETNDDVLVSQLLSRLDQRPKVIDEDGVTSKGFLGCCYANFGSRYHSLVSSLSQGTPSMGTSWAHKYEALFKEYHCDDNLISPLLDDGEISRKIDKFLAPDRNNQLRELLSKRSDEQKKKVKKMWQQIEKMIAPINNGRRNLI